MGSISGQRGRWAPSGFGVLFSGQWEATGQFLEGEGQDLRERWMGSVNWGGGTPGDSGVEWARERGRDGWLGGRGEESSITPHLCGSVEASWLRWRWGPGWKLNPVPALGYPRRRGSAGAMLRVLWGCCEVPEQRLALRTSGPGQDPAAGGGRATSPCRRGQEKGEAFRLQLTGR